MDCKNVLYYFEEINKIPRGSGNEKGISDYLVRFAKERGLWVHQDEALNVIIKKEATAGYENAPTVIIQGHMDMVCEKNGDVEHNFEKDPIKVIYDGDFIHADGTTLGADDGIAVAMSMALLDSGDIQHPKLEVVITTDEEVGMEGASRIDGSLLDGRLLINIDSEDEGIFTVGCAGGMKSTTTIPVEYEYAEKLKAYQLGIRGLKGGHSGIDIDKERANANKLLARAITDILKEIPLKVAEISGGAKDNAIPREAQVTIAINEGYKNKLMEEVEKIQGIFRSEYREQDGNIEVYLQETADIDKVFTDESAKNVVNVISLIPNGVQAMNVELGMPETSNNLGVVRTMKDGVTLTCAIRSSVISRKYYLYDLIKGLSELAGGNTIYRGNYPAWEYKPKSYLRNKFVDIYKAEYNVEPAIETIHAGLECGLFADKLEGADMISFGPNIYDVHTPDERASISSIDRMWGFLKKVLSDIKE